MCFGLWGHTHTFLRLSQLCQSVSAPAFARLADGCTDVMTPSYVILLDMHAYLGV